MDMKEKLKRQRMKKYALIALAIVVIIGVIAGFSLEGKDSKLEDGQGQIVVDNQGDALTNESVSETGGADGPEEVIVAENSADETINDEDEITDSELNEDGKTDDSDDPGTEADEKDKADADAKDKADSSKSDKPESGKTDSGNDSSKSDSKNDKNKSDKPVKETVKDKVEQAETAKDIELTEEEKKETSSHDIKVDNTGDATASNGGNEALKPDAPQNVTVTLEIRCDTLSEHMEYLENDALKDYIPEDGIILKRTTYKGTTENTVFDALNTLCRNNDIQMEFSYTPVYESDYIEGIGFLYEFDGGPQSGWMYSVNGWFPNYGCSSYYLHDGDVIVWAYTCRGYGADLGATVNG